MRKSMWAALCGGLVAACGGGGGDGGTPSYPTPLPVTQANEQTVARTAASAVASVSSASGGIASDSGGATAAFVASRQAALALQDRKTATAARPLATVSQTFACSGGGTFTLSANDANGNQALGSGDSIGFAFNACVELDVTLNGSLGITLTSYASNAFGGADFAGTMAMDLHGTTAGRTVSSAGSVSMTYAKQSTTDSRMTMVVGTSLVSRVTASGQNETIVYEPGFSYIQSVVTTVNDAPVSTTTFASGAIQSSVLNGRIVLDTPQGVVQAAGAPYPHGGVMTVTGANSGLRLTALSDGATLQFELDGDGNGSYDTPHTVPWTTVLPLN